MISSSSLATGEQGTSSRGARQGIRSAHGRGWSGGRKRIGEWRRRRRARAARLRAGAPPTHGRVLELRRQLLDHQRPHGLHHGVRGRDRARWPRGARPRLADRERRDDVRRGRDGGAGERIPDRRRALSLVGVARQRRLGMDDGGDEPRRSGGDRRGDRLRMRERARRDAGHVRASAVRPPRGDPREPCALQRVQRAPRRMAQRLLGHGAHPRRRRPRRGSPRLRARAADFVPRAHGVHDARGRERRPRLRQRSRAQHVHVHRVRRLRAPRRRDPRSGAPHAVGHPLERRPSAPSRATCSLPRSPSPSATCRPSRATSTPRSR